MTSLRPEAELWGKGFLEPLSVANFSFCLDADPSEVGKGRRRREKREGKSGQRGRKMKNKDKRKEGKGKKRREGRKKRTQGTFTRTVATTGVLSQSQKPCLFLYTAEKDFRLPLLTTVLWPLLTVVLWPLLTVVLWSCWPGPMAIADCGPVVIANSCHC